MTNPKDIFENPAATIAQGATWNFPFQMNLSAYPMSNVQRRLIARDLLLWNYNDILNKHIPRGLVTVGTPNWGYPYLDIDDRAMCPQLVQDMAGSWKPADNTTNPPSAFLKGLSTFWNPSAYGRYWLAAAGTFCQFDPSRLSLTISTGCPTSGAHAYSDGVVCADSATYSGYKPLLTPFAGGPTIPWPNPASSSDAAAAASYVHTRSLSCWGSSLVLCGSGTSVFPFVPKEIFRPVTGDALRGILRR